jgi:hypothetical protein
VVILDKLMETEKFVTISWSRINVSNICEYSPIPSQPVYDYLVALPDAIRGIWLQFLKDYEKDQKSLPTKEDLASHLRRKFKIPVSELTKEEKKWFANPEEFIIYFLHKNYPNDI